MDCCRRPESSSGDVSLTCPVSGTTGERVDRHTVKALLREAAMRRFTVAEYRFCADADCAVVYFSEAGDVFTTADVRVPVWQKEPFGGRMVCYCFGETESGIAEEFRQHGRSGAVDRVREHIAAARCACDMRNPRGVCCLGDVTQAVTAVERASIRAAGTYEP
jgi:hypothetical protein